MFPWKLLFRFFSAMVLFATGGFAAGHDLPLPFADSPAPVAAPAPADTTTTTTLPVVDPAPPAPPADDTTTTTTAPPVVDVPAPDVPAVPTVPTTVPPKPVTTTTTAPPAAPARDPKPVIPVDGDAPSVCAAAATSVCGPADPASAGTHAARVQRCQDWWNSLADAFDHNNRPEWAARARQIAGRCDEMITRWEQMEQRWQEGQAGDHDGDGHRDSGRPAPGPKPAKDDKRGDDPKPGKDADHRAPAR
jgi:hypothetical protein